MMKLDYLITNIGQNKQKWPPGGLYFQKQKLGVCNHKTQLLSGITFTVCLKIKPVIQIYANEADPSPFEKSQCYINFVMCHGTCYN